MKLRPEWQTGLTTPSHPKCVDMELLTEHFHRLARGEAIDVPKFNFSKQRRVDEPSTTIKLGKNDIVVVEGIHALNDELTAANPEALKLYISARTNTIQGR